MPGIVSWSWGSRMPTHHFEGSIASGGWPGDGRGPRRPSNERGRRLGRRPASTMPRQATSVPGDPLFLERGDRRRLRESRLPPKRAPARVRERNVPRPSPRGLARPPRPPARAAARGLPCCACERDRACVEIGDGEPEAAQQGAEGCRRGVAGPAEDPHAVLGGQGTGAAGGVLGARECSRTRRCRDAEADGERPLRNADPPARGSGRDRSSR